MAYVAAMATFDSPRWRNSDGFLTGKLLIAMPGMPDIRFEKSVIFVCSHSGERASGPATLCVTSDIALTPTVDILRAIVRGSGPEKFLFALGYAGWGPGQIEDEIAGNGWIHCDA